MPKVKEEWAQSILGQAIAEIQKPEDIAAVTEKVKSTAVGIRPDLIKVWDELIEAKKKFKGWA